MKHTPELGDILTEVMAGLQSPVQAVQPDIQLPAGLTDSPTINKLFSNVIRKLLLQESITEGQFKLIQTLIPYARS